MPWVARTTRLRGSGMAEVVVAVEVVVVVVVVVVIVVVVVAEARKLPPSAGRI